MIHTYVQRKQDAYMDTLISKSDGENVVLQVDFSENATIASQNETQSAHWCHGQATHFIAYAWIKEDENKGFVIVSDDLTHTKYSVYIFMEYIIKHLREKFPSIRVLNVFSELTWNFFATSHGKGVVDGLGGTVKRAVWAHVRSGQVHTTTADVYAKTAEQRNPIIHLQFIAKGDIDQLKPQLDAKWEGVLAVPKTHKCTASFRKGKEWLWFRIPLIQKNIP